MVVVLEGFLERGDLVVWLSFGEHAAGGNFPLSLLLLSFLQVTELICYLMVERRVGGRFGRLGIENGKEGSGRILQGFFCVIGFVFLSPSCVHVWLLIGRSRAVNWFWLNREPNQTRPN